MANPPNNQDAEAVHLSEAEIQRYAVSYAKKLWHQGFTLLLGREPVQGQPINLTSEVGPMKLLAIHRAVVMLGASWVIQLEKLGLPREVIVRNANIAVAAVHAAAQPAKPRIIKPGH